MGDLFAGLENFGLGNLKNVDVYEEAGSSAKGKEKAEKPKTTEADVVFEKTHTCPVCDAEFKSKMIRTGKVKLISADTDLRPKYQLVDSLKYDAVVCPKCGYSALNRFFSYVTSAQAKMIKEQISVNFKGIETEGDIYTYDDAIARHKLALLNTVVKKGKSSERAYTCLKLAWLLRGKKESMPDDTENYETLKAEMEAEEKTFIENAFEGFSSSFSKEGFPMCGMDEITMTYLIADLARRSGKIDDASRWISRVLIAKDANNRIKDKARELKELIVEAKQS